MHNFLYRCPVLGLMVQGTVEKASIKAGNRVLHDCPGCGRMHLVDPHANDPKKRSERSQA